MPMHSTARAQTQRGSTHVERLLSQSNHICRILFILWYVVPGVGQPLGHRVVLRLEGFDRSGSWLRTMTIAFGNGTEAIIGVRTAERTEPLRRDGYYHSP